MRRLISFKEFLDKGEPDIFFSGTADVVQEDVSGSVKKKKLKELETLLKKHDFYFSYSDDHRAYKKGIESESKIRKLSDEIGKDGLSLYRQFAKRAGVMEGYQGTRNVTLEKKIESVRDRHSVFPEMANVERNISLGFGDGKVLVNQHHFSDGNPFETTTKWTEPPKRKYQ